MEMELKIDKLVQYSSPEKQCDNEKTTPTNVTMETRETPKMDKKLMSIGKSNLIHLSLKNNQRKDGRARRCRSCATCKHKCEDFQACVGDNSKAKSGCKKRFMCIKSSGLIDDINLSNVCLKRTREDDPGEEDQSSKEMKFSNGLERKLSEDQDIGQVQHRIQQFETVSC